MEENNELINNPAVEYTDDNIRHLSDMEHVRTVPVCILESWVTDHMPRIFLLLRQNSEEKVC